MLWRLGNIVHAHMLSAFLLLPVSPSGTRTVALLNAGCPHSQIKVAVAILIQLASVSCLWMGVTSSLLPRGVKGDQPTWTRSRQMAA